jgi:CO/xanthine dehydrogenase FAD-binding subunit
MKAAEFEYLRPASLAEACEALKLTGDDSENKIIAGGQTLAPLMAMRLARPTLLIDINDIDDLKGIDATPDMVAIRAGTRQRFAERSDVVRDALPLLARALPFIGHWQTRNRGTIGGSLACADPSAEIPLVAMTLDAEMVALSAERGERIIPAGEFFEAAMMTSLAEDECLVEARFPVWSDAAAAGAVGTGFHEVSSRKSDFAVASAAAQVALDGDGVCRRIAVAVGGVAPSPTRLDRIEAALLGTRLDDNLISEATAGIGGMIDPDEDLHGTVDYRRRVAAVMAGRAIRDARDDALGIGDDGEGAA